MEQKRESMDKNRIGGVNVGRAALFTAKSIPIKRVERRSGDCAWKAAELTSGDLLCVAKATARAERRADRRAEVSRGHSRFRSWQG